MAYKIIKKYAEMLQGDHAFFMRGPISPLFMMLPWSRTKEHPLPIIFINKGRDSILSISEKNYFAICQERFARYYEGDISLQSLKDEYDNLAVKTQNLYDKIFAAPLKEASEEKLKLYMEAIIKLFDEIAEGTVYIEAIDYEKILEVIGKEKKNLLDSVWEKATHPTFISFEGRRLRCLIDLVSKGENDVVSKAKFIYTDYIWTKKDAEIKAALEDIKKNIKEKKEEYEKANAAAKVRSNEYKEWRETLDTDAEKIVDYMQLVMLFRDERKDMLAQILASLVAVSSETLSRAGIEEKYAPFTLMYEYIRGVKYLKSIKEEIEKRAGGFISIVDENFSYDVESCDFDEAIKELNGLIFKTAAPVETLKGQIANKGKVKGIVRIVLDPHDDKGFQKGDILVTSMTRPEFLHLMKKAGAVVTNEGGITCHAAIISRELSIPCVIGTKIATHALKDGDMVEVDADKGIVRIIK